MGGAVVLGLLLLLLMRNDLVDWLRRAVHLVSLPIVGLLSASESALYNMQSGMSRAQLLERIKQLEDENARLRFSIGQLQTLDLENQRLRQLLGWQQAATRWRTIVARVVLRDTLSWWHEVWIDRGVVDGVGTNSVVIVPEGLVGRVVEVRPFTSRVVLLGSPRLRVAAEILETGEQGIICSAPYGVVDYEVAVLTFLPQTAQLWAGQTVITSGIGGVFPERLVIGHVIDWRPVESGLYLEARVRLAAHLGRLKEVIVILRDNA